VSAAPHEDDVHPFWTVQAVFDPDGTGGDFAYTIGLSERGLPELHLYARPSLGHDPGADWKFSCRDCCGILNELGAMLVRGSLQVGSKLRREYDGGLAVVEFRVDPPGDRDQLEALGISPGADVLPVRWSLTRPPEGPPLPLTAVARERARQRYDEMVSGLDASRRLPRGWELPLDPDFDPEQRFGPMTPLVLARAAQMAHADERALGDFIGLANAVDHASSLSWPAAQVRAVGRPLGRTGALDALEDALIQVFDLWSIDPRLRKRWKSIVDGYLAVRPAELSHVTRACLERNLRDVLESGMRSCLFGEVVSDAADEELRLFAAGPWQSAYAPDGRPGPEWYAAEPVLDRVRQVLAKLTVQDLMDLGLIHRELSCDGARAPEGPYARLRDRLTSWAVVTAACCPPVDEVLTDPSVSRGYAVMAALGSREVLLALNDWLECLTSLLVHRARLGRDDIQVFCQAVAPVLPRLDRTVNKPV
jgi:hypothetical protein